MNIFNNLFMKKEYGLPKIPQKIPMPEVKPPKLTVQEQAKQLTPIGFQSTDGRFSIECCDEGMVELTMTLLDQDNRYYMHPEQDWVQKIEIGYEDIDRLIDILQKAKEIECRSWSTVKKKLEESKDKFEDKNAYLYYE